MDKAESETESRAKNEMEDEIENEMEGMDDDDDDGDDGTAETGHESSITGDGGGEIDDRPDQGDGDRGNNNGEPWKRTFELYVPLFTTTSSSGEPRNTTTGYFLDVLRIQIKNELFYPSYTYTPLFSGAWLNRFSDPVPVRVLFATRVVFCI